MEPGKCVRQQRYKVPEKTASKEDGPPGDKERRIALSISKLKAARYLDFGLEELVPTLWVESELEYDISAVYGITHWWFRRKEFYINNTLTINFQIRLQIVLKDKSRCRHGELGKWSGRLTNEKKEMTSSLQSKKKDYISEGSIKVRRALLGYIKDGDGDGNSQFLIDLSSDIIRYAKPRTTLVRLYGMSS
ncbi:hypothetical protein Tco_0823015 [Tanacetum coccineum]|uniref:Uncharacterized protein n=1 Tax=Tanacetum coccineum TaxID=301880 RepID=A0ABQ5AKU1_9ASTR